MERVVKNGDTVKIHYTAKLKDGNVFESSREHVPFQFTVGEGSVIPGLEKAVIGMKVGETKTVEIPPEEGFGPRHEELVFKVEKSSIPKDIEPFIGQNLQMQHPDGGYVNLIVTDIDDESITLDANHPLAGNEIIFELELVEIVTQ